MPLKKQPQKIYKIENEENPNVFFCIANVFFLKDNESYLLYLVGNLYFYLLYLRKPLFRITATWKNYYYIPLRWLIRSFEIGIEIKDIFLEYRNRQVILVHENARPYITNWLSKQWLISERRFFNMTRILENACHVKEPPTLSCIDQKIQ